MTGCWVINLDDRATKPGRCGVMLHLKNSSWVYWQISILTVIPIMFKFFNTLSNHQRFGHHIMSRLIFLEGSCRLRMSTYMLENTVIHSLNSQLTIVLWRTGQVMILLWGFMELRKWLSFRRIKLLFLSFSFILSLSQENLVIMTQGPVEVDIYQNVNSFLIRYVLHRIAITFGSWNRDLRW